MHCESSLLSTLLLDCRIISLTNGVMITGKPAKLPAMDLLNPPPCCGIKQGVKRQLECFSSREAHKMPVAYWRQDDWLLVLLIGVGPRNKISEARENKWLLILISVKLVRRTYRQQNLTSLFLATNKTRPPHHSLGAFREWLPVGTINLDFYSSTILKKIQRSSVAFKS